MSLTISQTGVPATITITPGPGVAFGSVGAAGVGVSAAAVAPNGHLLLMLTNGNTVDAGNAIGPAGATGPAGASGPAGTTGPAGAIGPAGTPPPLTSLEVSADLTLTEAHDGLQLIVINPITISAGSLSNGFKCLIQNVSGGNVVFSGIFNATTATRLANGGTASVYFFSWSSGSRAKWSGDVVL
jgi:hypothetical protein